MRWTALVVSLCFYVLASGQDTAFKKLLPRITHSLGIEDGLPTTCFEQIKLDDAGRMWLVTCADAQLNRQINLIQFDGHQGRVVDLGLEARSEIIIADVVKDSLIYGIDVRHDLAFKYDILKDTSYLFEPSDTELDIFQVVTAEDRGFVIGYKSGQLILLEITEDGLAEVIRHPGSLRFEADYLDGLLGNVIFTDGAILYTGGSDELHYYDLQSNEHSSYRIPSAEGNMESQLINWNGRVLVYWLKGPFMGPYEMSGDSLRKVSLLPQGWSYKIHRLGRFASPPIYSDNTGNLMLVCSDVEGNSKALLSTVDGDYYDYSDIWSLADTVLGRFWSEDFTQLAFTFGAELRIVELATDFNILTAGDQTSRAMKEFPNGKLLVLTSTPIMVDIRSGEIQNDTLPYAQVPLNQAIEFRSIAEDDAGHLYFYLHDTLYAFEAPFTLKERIILPYIIDYTSNYKSGFLFVADGIVTMFDPRTKTSTKASTSETNDVVQGRVNDLVIQGDTVFIATGGGLWIYNDASREQYKAELSEESNYRILSIGLRGTKEIWLGTESNGIVIYNLLNNTSERISTNEGLAHNTVVGLINDESGNIWASTFNGVSVINADKSIVANFYERDGLANNEGNRWSKYTLSDGRIIFGSVEGISIIDPRHVLDVHGRLSTPQTYISSLSHFDKYGNRITRLNPKSEGVRISIPAAYRSLIITANLSDYVTPDQNEYAYRFGEDGEWINVGNNPEIVFTNLAPGEYPVQVRGRNRNGKWSVNTIDINLDVKKFFYNTWWFYALCSIPVIIIALLWIWKSARERQRLEREVLLRTAEISRQAEQLREADKAKTRIYTNITHEYRTPLTVISGVSELIDNEDHRNILKRNASRMLNLTNQMLDLGKLQSGNLRYRPALLNVAMLLEEITNSFVPVAEQKDLSVHFHASPSDIEMDCDPEVLHRIIGNLLSNAVKFTPPGGNIYIDVRESDSQDEIIIAVRDTGIGIPAEKLDHIFDRFYQVDDSSTRVGEGTGIGLALAKELVEFLNGKIVVESHIEKGTSFEVTLPITRDASPELELAGELPGTAAQSLASGLIAPGTDEGREGRPNVLIVDDNADVIHYVISCLRDSYELHVAMDGEEGVEKALENVPDLVISDVMMPIKDGLQLCAELKADEHTSHVPVVLLTAKADIESRLEGLAGGADAYLSKPFNREELRLIIKNLIESRIAVQKKYRESPMQIDEPQSEDPDELFVRRLNDLIFENLDNEDFGVVQLCHALKYSRSQLYSKVKALTGLSVSAYIKLKRVQQAKKILTLGDHTISEVAYSVGFKDPNYFTRIFKKEYGINPSEYVETQNDAPDA